MNNYLTTANSALLRFSSARSTRMDPLPGEVAMKIAISVSAKEKARGEKSPYFQALCVAGLAPKEIVMLSPADRTRPTVENLDGVLFAGGEDVAPALYDEDRRYATVKSDRARDDFELALVEAAQEE